MQNKTKKQIKHELRRKHEQIGAMVLVVGMVTGMVAISTDARRMLKELAVRPAFAVIEHSGRQSETAHTSVRLDSVLRATPHGGE